jgi:hypothetical protein
LLWLLPATVLSWLPIRVPSQNRCRSFLPISAWRRVNRMRSRQSYSTSVYAIPQPELTTFDVEVLDRNGKINATTQLLDETIPDAPTTFHSTNQQQFWLDLRDTALFPDEALRFLQDQCLDDRDDKQSIVRRLVDAVLVSSTMFDKVVASNCDVNASSLDRHDFKLLYMTDDLQELIFDTPITQQSMKVGKSVYYHEKENVDIDLVTTFETVVQQRQWLLLEEKDLRHTQQSSSSVSPWMLKQIASLFQFMSAANTGLTDDDFEASPSGLLLPNATKVIKARERQHTVLDDSIGGIPLYGGIAIACTDRQSFVNIDATMAEFRNAALIGTLTTSSGLSIPSENGKDVPETVFCTALVLPLDVSIWELAFNLRLIDEEQI